MTQIVNDTFTDTAGTNLTAHTPDSGGTWSKWGAHASNIVIQANGTQARLGSTGQAFYKHSATPADQDVAITGILDYFHGHAGTNWTGGLCVRMQSGADSCYYVDYENNGSSTMRFRLIKRSAGSQSTLGTFNDTWGSGTRTVTLTVTGTTTTHLVVNIGGTDRITVDDSTSPISTAGAVGIGGNSGTVGDAAGIQWQSVTATDTSSGGGGFQAAWARGSNILL